MSGADDQTLPAEDILLGRTLGRCRILAELGRGGMGAVYRARHTGLDVDVAVKVLPPELAMHAAWRERFLREARMAARFAHPAAVRVLDVDVEDTFHYLVMELVDGASLGEALRDEGPMDWKRAVATVRPAAEALEAAHAAGLIHRDIKPDNLMRARDGEIKVTDFGLAREVEGSELTRTGQVSGSPAYMSPEQADGEKLAAPTDVYSLGVTLYALIAGKSPFARSSMMATLRATYEEDMPPLPGVPRALAQLLAGMTEKAPDDRLSTSEVVARLRAIEDAVARGQAPAPAPVARKRPPAPRKKLASRRQPASRRGSRAASRPSDARRAVPPTPARPPWAAIGGAAALVLVVVLALAFGGGGDNGAGSETAAAGSGAATAGDGAHGGSGSDRPGSGSPGDASAGSGSGPAPGSGSDAEPADPFIALEADLAGLAPAEALARVDAFVEAHPGHARALARRQALTRALARAAVSAAAAAQERACDAGRFSEARAATDAFFARPPRGLDAAQLPGLRAQFAARLEKRLLSHLTTEARAIRASLAGGQLDDAERRIAALQTLDSDRAKAGVAALRRELAAARAEAALAALAPRWKAALTKARAALDAGGLPAAPAALKQLASDASLRPFLDRPDGRAEPALLELRAATRFLEAQRAAIAALIADKAPVPIPLTGRTSVRTQVVVRFDGKTLFFAGRSHVPLSRVAWAARARWVVERGGREADADRVVGIALRLAGQTRLGDGYLARALELDPVAAAYCRAIGLTPQPADLEAPTTTVEGLSGKVLRTARADAARRGRVYLRGYELTPTAYATSLTPTWERATKTPLGGLAVDRRGRFVVVGSATGHVRLLDPATGKPRRTDRPVDTLARFAGVDSRGRPVIACGKHVREIHRLEGRTWKRVHVHPGTIEGLAFHPRLPLVLVSAVRAPLAIHRDSDWKRQTTLGPKVDKAFGAWLPDGRVARSGSDGRSVWRGAGQRWTAVVRHDVDTGTMSVAALSDERWVSTRYPDSLRAWTTRDVETPAKDLRYPFHVHRDCLAVHPSGALLVVGSSQGQLLFYDTRSWALLRTIVAYPTPPRHGYQHSVVFDGDTLYSAGYDGVVRRWDVPLPDDLPEALERGTVDPALLTGLLAERWKTKHPGAVREVLAEPRGRWFVSGCEDRIARLIRPRDGRVMRASRPVPRPLEVLALHPRTGEIFGSPRDPLVARLSWAGGWKPVATAKQKVLRLAFDSRGGALAVGMEGGRARVLSTRDWSALGTYDGAHRGIMPLAWRPGSSQLAIRQRSHLIVADAARKLAVVWTDPRIPEGDERPEDVAWAADGSWVASGCHAGHLKVYRPDGSYAFHARHLRDLPHRLAAHPTLPLLALSTSEGVLIYDARSWRPLRLLPQGAGISALRWTTDGLLVGRRDGTLRYHTAELPPAYRKRK